LRARALLRSYMTQSAEERAALEENVRRLAVLAEEV
jgi:hypothetical protein